ncbi:MAG: tRNA1(Val) (adenine(37)-N6)-methyltransferase [Bacillota bacterium]
MKLSKVKLKAGEHLDDLIHNDLQIIQDDSSFSFAIDAVLLANFTKVKAGERVVDLGTGSGVIPLLLAAKNEVSKLVGVELQSKLAAMARRSVEYNQLADLIEIKEMDIKSLTAKLPAESFDVVVSNPPYLPLGQGKISQEDSVAIAKHELKVTLEEIIEVSAYLVKYGGRVSYVYRSQRLVELLSLMRKYNLEPKQLRIVQPKADEDSNLVLVTGVKGANSGLEVSQPLVIYQSNGEYTKEVLNIYYNHD